VFLLTLRDLQYRAVRFSIAIVGTALVFSMALIMSGVYEGFQREPKITIEAIGADTWVIKDGVTGAFTSTSTIAAKTADDLRARGADRADPILIARSTIDAGGQTTDVLLFGYRQGGVGEPDVVQGSNASSPNELVADTKANVTVGEQIAIEGKRFTISGLTDRRTLFGGTPLVYIDVARVQELVFQKQPVASAIVVKGALQELPSGLAAKTTEETWRDALRPLEKPTSAINVLQYLLYAVAASIIGAVVYLSALERVRDFAVMKAVGASSRNLLVGLMIQSVLIAVVAAVVSAGIERGMVPLFPLLVIVPAKAYLTLPVVAIIVGGLASLGGLRRAVNVDPALAFSGPGG
jgi:putative ABC transport system permease protein